VLLPGNVMPLAVGRKRSMALVAELEAGHSIIGVAFQRDREVIEPGLSDLQPVGTFARVVELKRGRRGYHMVLEGLQRFRLEELVAWDPYWSAKAEVMADAADDADEARALAESLREQVNSLDNEGVGALSALLKGTDPRTEPGRVADQVAGTLLNEPQQLLDVLLTSEVTERLRLVTQLAGEAIAYTQLRSKIQDEVRREFMDNQKEAVLRKQLEAIQRELGEAGADDLSQLRERLDDAGLSDEAREAADRELARLSSMGPNAPESHMIRTYLEWVADLPWGTSAEVNDDLHTIESQLEADHFGLEKVKERILEHMAVLAMLARKRSGGQDVPPNATILCLAGPPGVGKTSLGRSIAEATGRPFVRIALGGVRDEAEIRGHRRTYIGSRPGRIAHALKKAGANNPVILLDEVDKLGQGWRGSPEDALLEVLDPEQNSTFQDHYLELPFDLTRVLFICTANNTAQISAPLLDRMELIEIQGYTPDEKAQIARRHLVPKQLERHGLPQGVLDLTDSALDAVIRDYTREPGVRQLDRRMAKLARAVALEAARADDDSPVSVQVDQSALSTYLGRPRFHSQINERTSVPGVATGLAWTPVGGDVLFVETSRMRGRGKLEVTGQLGEVMTESARAALTYVRSHARELGIAPDFLEKHDLHIHVPAGGVPKDGPSAGVTIFTALTSLLTGRRVRPDTAMTGECTLRGRVLPVGGIKAKVLAAHRAGLSRLILPKRNEPDLDEVPEDVRESMEIHLVEDMSEVLAQALDEGGPDAGTMTETPLELPDDSGEPGPAVA
jgi:ATP-dependent Lon protease